MKTFLIKFFIFCIPVILIPLFNFVYENTPFLDKQQPYNYILEGKISHFIQQPNVQIPRVIIGGDSRAERHLDPDIFFSETKEKTINLGLASLDLPTFIEAIQRYHLTDNDRIFLISISINQFNDGATELPYISSRVISEMDLQWQLQYFVTTFLTKINQSINYSHFWININSLIGNRTPQRTPEFSKNGYIPIFETLSEKPFTFSLNPKTTTHQFFVNLTVDNKKWNILKKYIAQMGNTRDTYIIFYSPQSKKWHTYIEGSVFEEAEERFAVNLLEETKKYSNIHFMNYYKNDSLGLVDTDFADMSHLNSTGAAKFTKIFIRDLRSLGLLP